MRDNFQDRPLENVIDDDNQKKENSEKFLLLTTELLIKDKIIEIVRIVLIKGKKSYFKGKIKK